MTSVIIVGRVLEKIDENTRAVEVSKPYKNKQGIFETFIVHAKNWNKATMSTFMQIGSGILVCLSGRLENDKSLGMYVLIEHIFGVLNEV